ncbi:MAG: DEAD/DEAH box helicase, partial [Rhodospirillales bacterium]|nr:DEAD/DEAH box helicase [Rhodospirillales bacterium]
MPTLPPNSEAPRILREVFGFSSFRTGQEELLAALLAATNVLVVIPTGSGKSLCFQIPA